MEKFVVLLVVFMIVGSALMIIRKKKSKSCPKCKSKYSPNDISDLELIRVVNDGLGSGKADVRCICTCSKCNHRRYVNITINAPKGKNSTEEQLLKEVYKYFC